MTIGTSFIDKVGVGSGSLPGWTLRWGSSLNNLREIREPGDNNIGDTVAFLEDNSPATTQGPLLTFDVFDEAVFQTADTDILILWRPVTSVLGPYFYVACRASGTAGAENGYLFRQDTGAIIRLSEISAGTVSDLASISWTGGTIDTWYWWQFRVVGDELKARWWEYGTAAPQQWQMEVTDSTHTAAGWIGWGHDSSSQQIEVDYFNVGLDGEYAQLPPNDPAPALNVVTCTPASVAVDADGFLNFYGAPNVAVSWAITAGGGSIGVIDDETNDAGFARAVFDPGSPGTPGTTTIEVTYGT
jgi:hypothetical protein